MRPKRKKQRKIGLHDNFSPDYLHIQDFGEKGRGIVASERITEGSFVVIYSGKRTHTEPAGDDTYVYEIMRKKPVWIDATVDDGSYGRLINDNHVSPNLIVKVVKVKGEDYPAFYANREIMEGEEITYDYGGGYYPWRNHETSDTKLSRNPKTKVCSQKKTNEVQTKKGFTKNCYPGKNIAVKSDRKARNGGGAQTKSGIGQVSTPANLLVIMSEKDPEIRVKDGAQIKAGITDISIPGNQLTAVSERKMEISLRDGAQTKDDITEISIPGNQLTAESEREMEISLRDGAQTKDDITEISTPGSQLTAVSEREMEISLRDGAQPKDDITEISTPGNQLTAESEREMEISLRDGAQTKNDITEISTPGSQLTAVSEREMEISIRDGAQTKDNITEISTPGSQLTAVSEREMEISLRDGAQTKDDITEISTPGSQLTAVSEREMEISLRDGAQTKDDITEISTPGSQLTAVSEREMEISLRDGAQTKDDITEISTPGSQLTAVSEREMEISLRDGAQPKDDITEISTPGSQLTAVSEREMEISLRDGAQTKDDITEISIPGSQLTAVSEREMEISLRDGAQTKDDSLEISIPGNQLTAVSEREMEISLRDGAQPKYDITEISTPGNQLTGGSEREMEISLRDGAQTKDNITEISIPGNQLTGGSEREMEISLRDGAQTKDNITEISIPGNQLTGGSEREMEISLRDGAQTKDNITEISIPGNQLTGGSEREMEISLRDGAQTKDDITEISTPGNQLTAVAEREMEISLRDEAQPKDDNLEISIPGSQLTAVSEREMEISLRDRAQTKDDSIEISTPGSQLTGGSEREMEISLRDGAQPKDDITEISAPGSQLTGGSDREMEISLRDGAQTKDDITEISTPGNQLTGHLRRVFVCSGSGRLKKLMVELVAKCGGEYISTFQSSTTHVIMQCSADEPRCCDRSLKYLLGIAHHCWVLDHHYVLKCLEAGYFLPEEEFEILGDEKFPHGLGASMSRQCKRSLMRGMEIAFTGESTDFPKDAAEDMVQSLGGEVKKNSSFIVSLEETGGLNTVDREWLFDCLSNFTALDTGLYCNGKYSEDISKESNTSNEDLDNDEDADYVPDSGDSESDSSMSDIVQINESGKANKENIKTAKVVESHDNSDEDLDNDKGMDYFPDTGDSENDNNMSNVMQINESRKENINTAKVNERKGLYVAGSKKTEDGRRKWDKKHACVFCEKQYPKLARHMENVHSDQVEVQRALAFGKGTRERKDAWKAIRNKGDFAHNTEVYRQGGGEIIPCKRPRKATEGTKYIQCKECKGTYQRSELWRHVKSAHPAKKGEKNQKKKSHQIESASLLPVSPVAIQEFREKILDRMANDEISIIARSDSDVVKFGQRQFLKKKRTPHQFNYIKQKMRELGRFVLKARAVDCSVKTLRDCISACKFYVCVTAVKALCGYDESNMRFDIPSLANKIGQSLHKVARKVRLDAMSVGDKALQENADNFITMYKEEWDVEVSHVALETIDLNKYNKPSRIPLAEDLKALSLHLKEQANAIMGMSEITQTEWRELCEVTLAQLVLFNKRRAGEAERLEVKQYVDGVEHGKTVNTEILESLSPLERKLTEVIDRVEIRGKRGRRVAVLLPENMKKQIDVLLQHRSCGNIVPDNMYVFARPGEAETPVRSTDVLRKYAAICGAKQPHTLTSTGFRKHVATISQMLNLKDNELDVLASFLGHDIRVHREYYRLPDNTIQVAKVSKLLLEMERGNLSKYKGLSLDEIHFDLDDPLECEQGLEEEEDEMPPNPDTEEEMDTMELQRSSGQNTNNPQSSTVRKTGNKKPVGKRTPWSEEEKGAVMRQLGNFLHLDRLPGKHNIVEAQRKEGILLKRPWTQIKFFIKNQKISAKRKH